MKVFTIAAVFVALSYCQKSPTSFIQQNSPKFGFSKILYKKNGNSIGYQTRITHTRPKNSYRKYEKSDNKQENRPGLKNTIEKNYQDSKLLQDARTKIQDQSHLINYPDVLYLNQNLENKSVQPNIAYNQAVHSKTNHQPIKNSPNKLVKTNSYHDNLHHQPNVYDNSITQVSNAQNYIPNSSSNVVYETTGNQQPNYETSNYYSHRNYDTAQYVPQSPVSKLVHQNYQSRRPSISQLPVEEKLVYQTQNYNGATNLHGKPSISSVGNEFAYQTENYNQLRNQDRRPSISQLPVRDKVVYQSENYNQLRNHATKPSSSVGEDLVYQSELRNHDRRPSISQLPVGDKLVYQSEDYNQLKNHAIKPSSSVGEDSVYQSELRNHDRRPSKSSVRDKEVFSTENFNAIKNHYTISQPTIGREFVYQTENHLRTQDRRPTIFQSPIVEKPSTSIENELYQSSNYQVGNQNNILRPSQSLEGENVYQVDNYYQPKNGDIPERPFTSPSSGNNFGYHANILAHQNPIAQTQEVTKNQRVSPNGNLQAINFESGPNDNFNPQNYQTNNGLYHTITREGTSQSKIEDGRQQVGQSLTTNFDNGNLQVNYYKSGPNGDFNPQNYQLSNGLYQTVTRDGSQSKIEDTRLQIDQTLSSNFNNGNLPSFETGPNGNFNPQNYQPNNGLYHTITRDGIPQTTPSKNEDARHQIDQTSNFNNGNLLSFETSPNDNFNQQNYQPINGLYQTETSGVVSQNGQFFQPNYHQNGTFYQPINAPNEVSSNSRFINTDLHKGVDYLSGNKIDQLQPTGASGNFYTAQQTSFDGQHNYQNQPSHLVNGYNTNEYYGQTSFAVPDPIQEEYGSKIEYMGIGSPQGNFYRDNDNQKYDNQPSSHSQDQLKDIYYPSNQI